ncbi:MAG: hypothetical protein ABGZ35_29075, partial [Planctomycetaceae bacterium]
NGNTDELLESATQAVSEQRLLDMVQQIDRTLTSDSESSPVVAGAVDEPFVAHGPNRTSNRF